MATKKKTVGKDETMKENMNIEPHKAMPFALAQAAKLRTAICLLESGFDEDIDLDDLSISASALETLHARVQELEDHIAQARKMAAPVVLPPHPDTTRLQHAVWRLEDLLKDDDPHAWKEARKFLELLKKEQWQEAQQQAAALRPTMFWDDDDPENCWDTLTEAVVEAGNNRGLEVGDEVVIQRAVKLSTITVRITSALDGEGEGNLDWEEIRQADSALPKMQSAVLSAERTLLTVRLTSFHESNGKRNWTAQFVRAKPWKGLVGSAGGITIAHGELWNRVAYEAERARFLIGERDTEPHIRDYGTDIQTPEEWPGEGKERAAIAAAKEK